ncbi:MAG: hypothetical protein MJZ95_02030 [Paludibacteraceae bacterium]|nr:hypothetical protein [Paludibacteraceae bacterium]
MLIAVDFDGTIVEHAYPAIGKPIPFAIDVLKRLNAEGHLLVLWTYRTGPLLEEAVQYCRERGVEFYAVNRSFPEEEWTDDAPRKIDADYFIDDKNIGGLPDWAEIYRIIRYGNSENAAYDNNTIETIQNSQNKKKKGFFSKLFG